MNRRDALALRGSRAVHDNDAGAERLVTCASCGGPRVVCGGTACCTRAGATAHERRWATAVRALYGGLLLTATPAAFWGGALVRFARHLGRGTPPVDLDFLTIADPECAISGVEATEHAWAYLACGDLARLGDLYRALQASEAPWLVSLWRFGVDAALLTPLGWMGPGLFAVMCDACAEPGVEGEPLDGIAVGADVYDRAIRCPSCGEIPEHPLPGVKRRELHPVGRCLPGLSAPPACQAHEGLALDINGLCDTGRRTVDRGLVTLATIGRASNPWERNLVDAFVRARWYEEQAQRTDSAIVRALVTSPELAPTFAALAQTNPGAARMLKEIGAPELGPADPAMVARMTDEGLLGRFLRALFEPRSKPRPSSRTRRKGGEQ